jgi:hypothetical protein
MCRRYGVSRSRASSSSVATAEHAASCTCANPPQPASRSPRPSARGLAGPCSRAAMLWTIHALVRPYVRPCVLRAVTRACRSRKTDGIGSLPVKPQGRRPAAASTPGRRLHSWRSLASLRSAACISQRCKGRRRWRWCGGGGGERTFLLASAMQASRPITSLSSISYVPPCACSLPMPRPTPSSDATRHAWTRHGTRETRRRTPQVTRSTAAPIFSMPSAGVEAYDIP